MILGNGGEKYFVICVVAGEQSEASTVEDIHMVLPDF